ncbi:Pentatricopeptide repeat-containing protein At3g03580, partial [Linum grandiflorum]
SKLPERYSQFVYSALAGAISTATTQKQLRRIHSRLLTLGLDRSVFFSGKLTSKYGQLKDPVSSLNVFRRASPAAGNAYQWNSIIRALTQNGLCSEALEIYSGMQEVNVRPDNYTFPSVINACAGLMDVEMGKVVHDRVKEIGFGEDLYIGNALVDMYARFGDLVNAREVFDKMPLKDRVSWNSLISGYSANSHWEEALGSYSEFRMAGLKPDCFTVSSVLPACGGLVDVEGEVIHGLVEKMGMKGDIMVNNGLLSMYFKFDNLIDARRVFDEMVIRDTVSWNILICGNSELQMFEESIDLFVQMVHVFRPDLLTITSVLRACGYLRDLEFAKFVHTYMTNNAIECDVTASNILIDTYGKCSDISASREVFDAMGCKDPVSWNSLISAYIQNSSYSEGLKVFKLMVKEFKPDSITCAMILSISAKAVDLDLGKQIHCASVKSGFDSDLVVQNALLDLYAKCWRMDDALEAFTSMAVRNVISWNTIITACGQAEDSSLGFRMINRMINEDMMPDTTTMLALLPICSTLAAKRQGKEVHAFALRLGFDSDVAIGNALVEMYSKCGSIKDAVKVFRHMKLKDVVTWTSLISAYGMHGEGKEALRAFEEMKAAGVTPDRIAFVAVIYACSHSGLVDEGLACFHQMKEEHCIEPRIEHYACVVDLLSRSGQLSRAETFIGSMPVKPDASIWGALLSACVACHETKIAERVSHQILQLELEDPGYYVLASNVFAALGKWEQVKTIRKSIKARGMKKEPGRSWIEIRNKMFAFGSADKLSEHYEEISNLLDELGCLMSKVGYSANVQDALHDIEEDEKRDWLCGHSERLAIAFGMLRTDAGSPLRVMKNLRVCRDCHTWTKYASKVTKREILVRDANRFHLFADGECSCGDHW